MWAAVTRLGALVGLITGIAAVVSGLVSRWDVAWNWGIPIAGWLVALVVAGQMTFLLTKTTFEVWRALSGPKEGSATGYLWIFAPVFVGLLGVLTIAVWVESGVTLPADWLRG